MGLTRQYALRATLYFLATLSGIAGSLVLVRKLDPGEYAFYQGLTKRAFLLGWMPFALTALVLYRRLASRSEGSTQAFLFQSLFTTISLALAALAWSLLAGAPLPLALASVAALIILGLWSSLRFLLDALRPVKVSLAILLSRLALSALLVATVYFLGLGVMGALASSITALGVGALYMVHLALESPRFARGGWRDLFSRLPQSLSRGARESLRIARFYGQVNLINMTITATGGLDVFLVAVVRGLAFTAPFLAFHSIVSLVQETLGWSSRLFARNLLTGEASVGDVGRTMRLVILVASPLLLLAAFFPTHVAMILNPEYAPHSRLLTITALGYLAFMTYSFLANTALGTIRLEDPLEERRLLTRMYRRILAARLAYLALALASALIISEEGLALSFWGGAFALEALLMTVAALQVIPPRDSHLLAKTALYATAKSIAIGLPLALFMHTLIPPPQPLFWEALRLLTPYFTAYLATYYILLTAIDPGLRDAVRKLPSLLKA